MLLKLKFDPLSDPKVILSFACVEENFNDKKLNPDEILVPATSVPRTFYSRWREWAVVDDHVEWSDTLFHRYHP